MNSSGPALRDIHLPQVSWWPLAPGWWALCALLLLASVVAVVFWWRGRNERALRGAARQELDALASRHARDHDDVVLAAGLSHLLRRIALRLQPGVAANNGLAWREFLSTRAQAVFTNEQIHALVEAPYRARASFDADALLDATRRWCEQALRARVFAARDST